MHTFEIKLAEPIVRIATGGDATKVVEVDLRKIPGEVLAELLRQGVIKPLTDISADKAKAETLADVHDRRLKRVANWYNGDFSVRGGGVADPVSVQMKEEITRVFREAGANLKDEAVKEALKGTAAQIIARHVAAKMPKGKPEEVEAEATRLFNHYRTLAEATLKARRDAAAKIDVKAISL